MRRALLALSCAWGACSTTGVCPTPSTVLVGGAQPITCEAAEVVPRWASVLASRPLLASQHDRILVALRDRGAVDPGDARHAVDGAQTSLADLLSRQGLAQAEARSHAIYEASHGSGPVPQASFPDASAAEMKAIAVWATDDSSQLALSESDIEGWIFYASLCREAQGGGTVAISVAGRVEVYRAIVERWKGADRQGKIALAAVGPYWASVKDAWAAASYDQQQAWIREAPLPAPMTGTSPDYVDVLLRTDVVAHATLLHRAFGPLHLWGG